MKYDELAEIHMVFTTLGPKKQGPLFMWTRRPVSFWIESQGDDLTAAMDRLEVFVLTATESALKKSMAHFGCRRFCWKVCPQHFFFLGGGSKNIAEVF